MHAAGAVEAPRIDVDLISLGWTFFFFSPRDHVDGTPALKLERKLSLSLSLSCIWEHGATVLHIAFCVFFKALFLGLLCGMGFHSVILASLCC